MLPLYRTVDGHFGIEVAPCGVELRSAQQLRVNRERKFDRCSSHRAAAKSQTCESAFIPGAVFQGDLHECSTSSFRLDDLSLPRTLQLGAPDVSGTAITVEVRNGQVQLSGFVKSKAEAQRAIELTQRVEGVRNVINKMTIRA